MVVQLDYFPATNGHHFMALSLTKRCVSGVDTHTFQNTLIARSVFLPNGGVGLLTHRTTGMVELARAAGTVVMRAVGTVVMEDMTRRTMARESTLVMISLQLSS
jgi:hypothetical protein